MQLPKDDCHLVGLRGTAWPLKEEWETAAGTQQTPEQVVGWGWGQEHALTLTCSFEVTAQKTISVKP